MMSTLVAMLIQTQVVTLYEKPKQQGLAPGAMTTQANPNVDTAYVEEQVLFLKAM